MCMQAWARADMLGITCSFQFLFPFFHL
jgi:hypothetical protein